MPVAATSTPREARWLKSRLEAPIIGLPVAREVGRVDTRHIIYQRQGGTDIHVVGGITHGVRSAWLCYVSQPTGSAPPAFAEALEFDADNMNGVLLDSAGARVVNGRLVWAARRDSEHYLPVYDDDTLALKEVQLGGVYIVLTSLATT